MLRLLLILLTLRLVSLAQANDPFAASSSAGSACPVAVVKMNPSHESIWNNLATMRTYGTTTVSEHNKFLEVKVKNNADKTIRGVKFVTAYYDSTEDLTTIPHTWGLHGEVKPGQVSTGNWDTNAYQKEAAIGWLILPWKILYTDGTAWKQAGNDCGYEWWKNKKHPRVNKAPDLDGIKQQDRETEGSERAATASQIAPAAIPTLNRTVNTTGERPVMRQQVSKESVNSGSGTKQVPESKPTSNDATVLRSSDATTLPNIAAEPVRAGVAIGIGNGGFLGASSEENPKVRRDGVTLSVVDPGGPADQAGIRAGDVILAVDDHYFYTVEDLLAEVRNHKPGSHVHVRYRRRSAINEADVILEREHF